MSRSNRFRIEWAPYAVEYLGTNKLPSAVTIDGEVGSGGEAVIYSIREIPNALIKLYRTNDPRELSIREGKIKAMIKAKPQEPTPRHITFAWPLGIIRDENGNFRGFIMPYIRCAVPISNFFDPNDYSWLDKFRSCGVPEDRLDAIRNNIELFRVGVALNLVKAVGYLHAVGHFVGDLNDRNVLVNSNGLVTLIDTDSFFIRDPDTGRTYPSEVGVGEYTAPEVLRGLIPPDRRSEGTDVFSLSVIIFKLLMNGYHPFAGTVPSRESNTIEDNIRDCLSPYFGPGKSKVRKPIGAPNINSLPPELTNLFKRVFQSCDGSGRPSMEEFLRVLENYYKIKWGIHQLGIQRLDLSQFEQCFPNGIAKLREFMNKYRSAGKMGFEDWQIVYEIARIIDTMLHDGIYRIGRLVNATFIRIKPEAVDAALNALSMPESQVPQNLIYLVKSMKQDSVTSLPALIINGRKIYEGQLPPPDVVKQTVMDEVMKLIPSSRVMIMFYMVVGRDEAYENAIRSVVTEVREKKIGRCPDLENLIVRVITSALDELGIDRYSITEISSLPSPWLLNNDVRQIILKIFPNLDLTSIELFDAVKRGDLSKVIDLIRVGANVNAKDAFGRTPLHYAVLGNRLDIVKYLVEHGADVNVKDNNGVTPLHLAAGNGYLDIVKYLIKHKAKINVRDNDGKTPLDYAEEHGHDDVADYLEEIEYQKYTIMFMVLSVIFLLGAIGAQSVGLSVLSAIFAILALVLTHKWYTMTWLVVIILTAIVLAYPRTMTLAVISFIIYVMFLLVYRKLKVGKGLK